ncbi:polysaccharide deacetylase family protein [Drepanopeziza brunnea f. sp. 'multigermtubi' MB_m1]|uniref:Polysaccharide deacetylase family protein n=1 Tax=Marssonina brunnea f. sp. multigermtubi (strain MB_m1) TaxID=1072389 RepID=K1WCU8_MARBU|nr:polysaccharide deacetylase family protein [Drepanopeziza brunnea f. sp. 'multigermtubi' MB_m1]EKD15170.1 polysaccharide deacetylase family protein [Drepanopeziza brunnea f. sp. 'multigermtubi' MB_m1]
MAQPKGVARAMEFLSSHKAACHISGESVPRVYRPPYRKPNPVIPEPLVFASLAPPDARSKSFMLSIDFDAVSGLLGTGASPQNNIAGDSFGFFACQPRIDHQNKRALNILITSWLSPRLAPPQALQGSRHRFKHNLVHSMESIPSETQQILNSGAEIACLHGNREGGERRCPGSRKHTTVKVLEESGFLYEEKAQRLVQTPSSTHRDYEPDFLPEAAPIQTHRLPAPPPSDDDVDEAASAIIDVNGGDAR